MDTKTESIKRKQSGVRLNPDVVKKLKHLSIELDRSFSSLVEEAVEELLKKFQKS